MRCLPPAVGYVLLVLEEGICSACRQICSTVGYVLPDFGCVLFAGFGKCIACRGICSAMGYVPSVVGYVIIHVLPAVGYVLILDIKFCRTLNVLFLPAVQNVSLFVGCLG